jgi:two-component system chemotaxis response regulator CheY
MSRKPILIIEDDICIREVLEQLFKEEGYPVVLAENGQIALDILKLNTTTQIGLILLDVMMPVMDGPTFLLALQRDQLEIFTHTPIFIMTARADAAHFEVKTTGLLKKPLNLEELCRIAELYCGDPSDKT